MQQMQLGNGLVQLLATLQRTEYLKNDRQKKRVLTNEDGENRRNEFAIDDGKKSQNQSCINSNNLEWN